MTEGSSGGFAAASDAEIEAALEHAHVPSLINALVHLTGDISLIRGDIRAR